MKRYVIGLLAGSLVILALIAAGGFPTGCGEVVKETPTTSTTTSTTSIPPTSTSTSTTTSTSTSTTTTTTTSTTIPSDINGDGFSDVIVGAMDANAGGTVRGGAYVFFGGSPMDSAPDVTVTGESDNDHLGRSVSLAGDVNGDGFADVIVGADSAGPTIGSDSGEAYVYFGSGSISGDKTPSDADVIIKGNAAADYLGRSVSSAGDVNGDGYADVIIGAHMVDGPGSDRGQAYIFFGSGTLSGTKAASDADVTITGGADDDRLGRMVSSAGDVNGDGYADVIVGAPYIGTNKGKAYIFLGGSSLAGDINILDADVTISGANDDDYLGLALSSAGDVNGDGYDDVMVGGPGVSSQKGEVYIFFGGSTLSGNKTPSDADLTLVGGTSGDVFGGWVSSAADVNGDGYADMMVGAQYADGNGKSYVFFGGSSIGGSKTAAQADVTVTGAASGDLLGNSVSSAGSVNGNTYADIIMGAPGVGPYKGGAYIFYGGSGFSGSKSASAADVTLVGANDGDYFGGSVSGGK